MRIGVYIDNNVWDFLFERKMDLTIELPRDEFVVCITREAEFEISPLETIKPELFSFIQLTIERCQTKSDAFFGFNDESLPLAEQRVTGFDQGRFISPEEQEFMVMQRTPLKPSHSKLNTKTKLYKDEADISLAARAFHSVVLSLDGKKGPINTAYQQGGRVVFLKDYDAQGMSLANYIKNKLAENAAKL